MATVPTMAKAPGGELRARWRLLLAAMIGTGVGMPTLPFYTIGVFAPSLVREFHWTTSVIFTGLSIALVGLLVTAPIAGALVDRFGARRVAALSLTGLSLSYMSLALSTGSVLQYDLTWLAIAITGAGATPIGYTRVIASTFTARRGLALGITLAGSGVFVLLIKPLALAGVLHFGWRPTVVAAGLLPLLVGVPVTLWGLSEGAGLRIARVVSSPQPQGMKLSGALRTRAFWILLVCFAAISFASAAPFPQLDNIMRSLHLPAEAIIAIAPVTGAAIIVGRLTAGWVIDRVWAPLVGLVMLLSAALASLMLAGTEATPATAAIAAGLLGLAAGTEIDLLSFLTARYIGVRSYGSVYGFLYGIFAVGAGLGPALIGVIYDRSGTYGGVMTACAGLLAAAALLLLALGRYPAQPGGIRTELILPGAVPLPVARS